MMNGVRKGPLCNTDNPLYTNTRYSDKLRYDDNLTVTKSFAKEVTISHKLSKNIVFNTLKKHMFWIFVRIA